MAIPTEAQLKARFRPKVEQDLVRRGGNVKRAAQGNLRGGGGYPRRIDTRALQQSIGVRVIRNTREPRVRIGSSKEYARYVHDGTGIYGPRRRPIRPVKAQALVFPSRRYGKKSGPFRGKVVVKSVKGIKPNPYLVNALHAARD